MNQQTQIKKLEKQMTWAEAQQFLASHPKYTHLKDDQITEFNCWHTAAKEPTYRREISDDRAKYELCSINPLIKTRVYVTYSEEYKTALAELKIWRKAKRTPRTKAQKLLHSLAKFL